MNQFTIDESRCTQCGTCAKDCPAGVIQMDEYPVMEKSYCIKCQHCLAVCPTGALSILGNNPEDSTPLKGNLPNAQQMKALIQGRRSVRQYKDEDLEPETIRELVGTAWHAPTAFNAQVVHLTVLENKASTDALKEEVYRQLEKIMKTMNTSENPEMRYFKKCVDLHSKNGTDLIFRNAPHLVIASGPAERDTTPTDTHIFLSYLELTATAMGLGTLWNGLLEWAFDMVDPLIKQQLGIPNDNRIGGVMMLGKPAVKYLRTVTRGTANMVLAKWQ